MFIHGLEIEIGLVDFLTRVPTRPPETGLETICRERRAKIGRCLVFHI